MLTGELDLYGIAIIFRVELSAINSANFYPAIISSFKVKLMKQKSYFVPLRRRFA